MKNIWLDNHCKIKDKKNILKIQARTLEILGFKVFWKKCVLIYSVFTFTYFYFYFAVVESDSTLIWYFKLYSHIILSVSKHCQNISCSIHKETF